MLVLDDWGLAPLRDQDRFRLARTSDLLDYAFAGVRPDTAAARLRRLFDAKHLAVLPPRQGFENVYRLGPAAASELTAIPDLFVLVRFGTFVYPVAIEVDFGTESHAVLHRKLEVYRSLWGRLPGLFGWGRFGIAVACYAPSRRSADSSALKKAWVVPHVFWVAPEGPSTALCKLFEELRTPLSSIP